MNDKTIVQISSHLEMVGFLKANGTQCRFVSMVSETPVKNIRAASPFKGVIKTSRKRGMINVNYTDSVRRKIAAKLGVELAAVDYEAGEVWYRHLETVDGKRLPVVVNKKVAVVNADTEYYLQYFPTSSTNSYAMPDGKPVAEAELEKWFYADNRPDFKPTVISIKVTNILRLAASGVIMQTEDIEEAEAALAAAI